MSGLLAPANFSICTALVATSSLRKWPLRPLRTTGVTRRRAPRVDSTSSISLCSTVRPAKRRRSSSSWRRLGVDSTSGVMVPWRISAMLLPATRPKAASPVASMAAAIMRSNSATGSHSPSSCKASADAKPQACKGPDASKPSTSRV